MWYHRIKQIRKTLKLTQKEFAEELKVKPTTYQMWESGKNEPPLSILMHISAFTHKSLDWILLGEGSENIKEGSCVDTELRKYLFELGITSKTDMEGFFQILQGYLGVEAYKALIELLEQRGKLWEK